MIENPNFRDKEYKRVLKKGKVIALERGIYSDHSVIGVFTVIKELNMDTVKQIYRVTTPMSEEWSEGIYHFANYLVERGYLEEITYSTWHLGSYDLFDCEDE